MINGMSLILPTYHPARVKRANQLIKMLRLDSGIDIEIIVVTDNPETHNRYKGADFVCKLPQNVGFNRAANIGEKFAKYRNEWWIDDYVIPEPNWGPKALSYFWEHFPDGMGILDISMQLEDCAKSVSTRSYVYSLNHFNLLWPEYLHCGDTEMWYRSTAKKKFLTYPEMLWHRDKIWDDCKKQTDAVREFDVKLRGERELAGWPDKFLPLTEHDKEFNIDIRERLRLWTLQEPESRVARLYKNLYNL